MRSAVRERDPIDQIGDGRDRVCLEGSSTSLRLPRRARWVPWVLFVCQLVITAVVIGVLSFVMVVQLTLVPGAIIGEYDGLLTSAVSLVFTGIAEVVASLIGWLMLALSLSLLVWPSRWLPHGP